jgi:hypothetical protein
MELFDAPLQMRWHSDILSYDIHDEKRKAMHADGLA